ncbi:hypothetical protein ACFL1B_04245 [Nanoarchaeota archaeon]
MAKKRGEDSSSDKLALKRAVQKKITYLMKKPKLHPGQIYNLIKDYFKACSGHEYEYTREELLRELNKIYLEESMKERLEDVILKLGVVEFAPADYTQEELKSMLEIFSHAVDLMAHTQGISLNFWDKLAHKLKKKAKKVNKEDVELSPMQKFVQEADKTEEEIPAFEEIPEENVPEPSDSWKQLPEEFESSLEPGLESPGEPGQQGRPETSLEFNTMLQSFYDNLGKGRVHVARLEYEELKHAYDWLEEGEKHNHYARLTKAHEDLMVSLDGSSPS